MKIKTEIFNKNKIGVGLNEYIIGDKYHIWNSITDPYCFSNILSKYLSNPRLFEMVKVSDEYALVKYEGETINTLIHLLDCKIRITKEIDFNFIKKFNIENK